MEVNKVYNMNCLELMKTMEDNSVDAIVTDPPYGLSEEPDMIEVLKAWINNEPYVHSKSGFMNREWDSFVPGPEYWKECYRILKPGGHLLSFGGTRTFDLISIALRLAGFERRDTVMYLYGTGFPKSLDISKQIDKLAGAEREVIGKSNRHVSGKPNQRTTGLTGTSTFAETIGMGAYITTPSTQNAKDWNGWGTQLKPAFEPILLCRKPIEKGLTIAQNVLKWGTGGININGCRIGIGSDKEVPGFVQSKLKNGYSKLEEREFKGNTIYGAERINMQKAIDNCQLGRFPANLILDDSPEVQSEFDLYGHTKSGKGIEDKEEYNNGSSMFFNGKTTKDNQHGDSGNVSRFFYTTPTGRFPTNVIHDGSDEVEGEFDQFGDRSSARSSGNPNKPKRGGNTTPIWGMSDGRETHDFRDNGTASRFFYASKASVDDREEGLDDFEPKFQANAEFRPNHLEDAELGESGKPHGRYTKRKNNHPTVKNCNLCMYLCRMITPPSGLIFDPFAGSGSTGKAAIIEGFRFVGAELEAEYAEIANARIQHAIDNKDMLFEKYNAKMPKVYQKEKIVEPDTNEFF